MTLLLLTGWGLFAFSARRRWKLLMVGAPANRLDNIGERIARTWKYAILQVRMHRYPLAGIAHACIFIGFMVLLPRTLVLWGRGFDPSFDLWILGSDGLFGKAYSFLKDVFAVLVIGGALVFVYFRVVQRLPRMTLSGEGLLILGIIVSMMVADILYDGASIVKAAREPDAILTSHGGRDGLPRVTPREFPSEPGKKEVIGAADIQTSGGATLTVPTSTYRELTAEEKSRLASSTPTIGWIAYEPAGSLAAKVLSGASNESLGVLAHIGFWTHASLVLIFLNLLPYSKHFHVITGIPNVFLQNLAPVGRLPNIEDIDGKLERSETLGIRRLEQFSWKSILDFYTCTECGRCSDHCPATKTGKKLSPKHFTLVLRNFLYKYETDLVTSKHGGTKARRHEGEATGSAQQVTETALEEGESNGNSAAHQIDLVDGVIDPEVLWACTSCRACEQECPVFITYVDKIVDMRRYLVQERGEFPQQLQSAFRGMESSANPWSFPAEDRPKWAEGMNVKTIEENPDAPVLFWVGCAPSFDERAKKVTRATAKLMQMAGVDFAILGTAEQCTGDPARRAGNEYLYQMFAKANVEVLNGVGADKKKIVTSCPHCFNTLLNEYPDFGGRYDVIHHTTFLAQLLQDGKLKPTKRLEKSVVYHDSCYLGRYNEVYDAPREALRSIGLTVLEPVQTRDRGMCCGAGGAQMFKEEEHGTQRVNALRTEQLLDTKPDAIASACPFCMRMLTDGLAEKGREALPQLDVAEMMLEAFES